MFKPTYTCSPWFHRLAVDADVIVVTTFHVDVSHESAGAMEDVLLRSHAHEIEVVDGSFPLPVICRS